MIESFVKVSNDYFGNPSSLHGMGGTSGKIIIKARKQIADFICVNKIEIYFTSGGTEGNNLAIKGLHLPINIEENILLRQVLSILLYVRPLNNWKAWV